MRYQVRDVRVAVEGISATVKVAYCGGAGSISDVKAGAVMLAVFNTERACFWDGSTRTFTTDPFLGATALDEAGPTDGFVTSWDVAVTDGGSAKFFVTLATDDDLMTSGSAVSSWDSFEVDLEQAGLVIQTLLSPYCVYRNGKLLNSDIN